MSSNLKVNTILPSTGDTVSIAGIASITSSVSIASSCTATTFFGSGANLTGIDTDLLSDTTPQLGGNLDLNGKFINGTGGVNVTGVVTATSFSGSGEGLTRTTQLSHRNKVINGDMRISQRGTSFTNIGGNTEQYTLDRFKLQTNSLDQAVATISQDSSAPVGFSKSLKIQCTTAETSVEDSEHARLIYDGEAFDFTDIGFGTSSAKKVTLSFWVKSNLTGTWGINFWRGDANRSNLRTYTINSANTWEHKVITLSADTAGGGVNSDNGYGFRINWGLATGANFATSHPLDTWHTFNQQYFYPYDARNTNFYSSTSNNFYLTGVQLEVGEQATPFEHRSYGEELSRCKRYYYQETRSGSTGGNGAGIFALGMTANSNGGSIFATMNHPVEMRAAPNVTFSGTFAAHRFGVAINQITAANMSGGNYHNSTTATTISGSNSGSTPGQGTLAFLEGVSGTIMFSAEL
jgi:hypothetical protein